jgi:hypothetical protein
MKSPAALLPMSWRFNSFRNYFKNPSGVPCSKSSPFAEGGTLDASLAVGHT